LTLTILIETSHVMSHDHNYDHAHDLNCSTGTGKVNASGVPSYKSCYKIDSNKGSTFSKKFQKKYQCTAHACNSDSSVQSHARAAPPMPDSTPDRNARCTLLTFLEPQAPRAEIDMPGVPSRAATRERCSITISKIITRARLQCVCLCRADWMS
jgi:hypothetical protein